MKLPNIATYMAFDITGQQCRLATVHYIVGVTSVFSLKFITYLWILMVFVL